MAIYFKTIKAMPELCRTCSCMLGKDYKSRYTCRPENLLSIFSEGDPELLSRIAELIDEAQDGDCPEYTTEYRQDAYTPYHEYDIELDEEIQFSYDEDL